MGTVHLQGLEYLPDVAQTKSLTLSGVHPASTVVVYPSGLVNFGGLDRIRARQITLMLASI